jgi:hypothetical protein
MPAHFARKLCVTFLAVAAASGALAPARAEHGSPGYASVLDEGATIPRTSLIPLRGANGVTFGFKSLALVAPRLVSPAGTVPLRLVDSYDDLEGHAQAFDSDDRGYGENLLLFAPQAPLRPGETYALEMTVCAAMGGCKAGDKPWSPFSVTVGPDVDVSRPIWKRPPFLALRTADEVVPHTIFTAFEADAHLPYFVIVELSPRGGRGRPKRMIATLGRPKLAAGERDCDTVAVYDHEPGVFSVDVDRDLGRPYLARLIAMDSSGNRAIAPGDGVPVIWNGKLSICNLPTLVSLPMAPLPARPTWTKRPHLVGSGEPASETEGATRERLVLPVRTSAPLFVEVTLARPAPPHAPRLLALVEPRPDGECAIAFATNEHRETLLPLKRGRATARVTLLDLAARRTPQEGPPIALLPTTTELEVCLEPAAATSTP